jgi:hypothetical protein
MSDNERQQHVNMEQLVEMANANAESLKGCGIDKLRDHLRGTDIVWGVWQDPAAEHGVDAMIIKGEAVLRFITASGVAEELSQTAISCRSVGEAEALRITLFPTDANS